METSHFKLTPKPPYSFDLTAGYLAYFQGHYGADRLEDGVFSRLLDIDGKLALLRVSSAGTVGAPLLELSVAGDGLDEAEDTASSQRLRSAPRASMDFFLRATERPPWL